MIFKKGDRVTVMTSIDDRATAAAREIATRHGLEACQINY